MVELSMVPTFIIRFFILDIHTVKESRINRDLTDKFMLPVTPLILTGTKAVTFGLGRLHSFLN